MVDTPDDFLTPVSQKAEVRPAGFGCLREFGISVARRNKQVSQSSAALPDGFLVVSRYLEKK
jgi:hypothetical protein